MIPFYHQLLYLKQEKRDHSTQRAWTSLVYVLSMAVTYTLVGVISGLIGADIQSCSAESIYVFTFAVIFFALAISLFGYYEIQLPASWQSKINSISDNAQGTLV